VALEGGVRSAARPSHTLPPGKTQYPFYRRLGGAQSRSGWAENLVPTGIRSRTVQSPQSVAIPIELPGPWIKSQWGEGAKLSATVQCDPAAHPASYTMGTASHPGLKWPGCGVNHPSPYSTKVKERVELYLYSPSVSSWQVRG